MKPTSATINIKNLRLRTYIGFNQEEIQKKQDIVINIEIKYSINEYVLNDHVEQALNYKVITKRVIEHVENGRFLLLEALVAKVLELCCADSSVKYGRVTIDKPNALRFSDSVSLTLEFESETSSKLHSLEIAS